jgi:penicillin-binding protein 2
MSVIHAPRKPNLDVRVLAFPVVMVLLFSILFFRLWYVQVVKAPELRNKAAASRIVPVKKLAPRGLILDRNGAIVAGVRPEIVVTAKPAVVREHPQVLERVAEILGVDVKRLQRKVDDGAWRPFIETPIFVGASIQAGARIAEEGQNLPGIGVETQPMRFYPDSTSFTHVLGYVATPNEKDLERIARLGVEPADYVGKSGIERALETHLIGRPGIERLEVDVKRRPVRVAGRDAATPGSRIMLTLDGRLQTYARELLESKGYVGAVVAIDPQSGEVLCLTSSPTFDQRVFHGGISESEWKALTDDPKKPMVNRAVYSSYPPGSTFKIVTALAALQRGLFSPSTTIVCDGGLRLGSRTFRCMGRHGPVSFETAMAKSCNVYFYELGRRAGEQALREASAAVGLGQPTGIEVGGESAGIVPTLEWVAKHKDGRWFPGDTLNFSIGQGDLTTTPIQMAHVAALVANNGVAYRPHLLRTVFDSSGEEVVKAATPDPIHRVLAPDTFWAQMRRSLVAVIDSGTAASARIPGVQWGGKTGSAQHTTGQKSHGWFVGFAPAENPRIAICVFVEAAGHGGEVAAPIAREIVKRHLELTGVLGLPEPGSP